jgi:transposase-like protein
MSRFRGKIGVFFFMSEDNEKCIANFLKRSFTNKYINATIKPMRYTLKQFQAEYPDDDACLEAVFQDRFGNMKCCPACGVVDAKFHRVKKRQCYACQWCGYQLFPLANTIFRKTTTPLTSWFYAVYLFSVAKNGVSAKELERHLGVTYKTAWRMARQIRILMQQENAQLTGTIEADETYIGGKHRHKYGRSKKQTVFGMVERDGSAKVNHVKSSGARVLLPVLQSGVDKEATIYTDEYGSYKSLAKRGYSHTTINHSALEYVRGIVHTNTVEGFWGQLKRSIDGTYHSVSPKYLQSYLDEFVFRYNFRGVAVGPVLLERALKPV